jgi:phosphoribosylformylglycinamidine synthase subunit PurS
VLPHTTTPERPVARVLVDVMLKPEILDPQGQAVQQALGRLGFQGVHSVRQGKRFVIDVDAPADAELQARAEQMADTLLANQVIEDYTIHLEA